MHIIPARPSARFNLALRLSSFAFSLLAMLGVSARGADWPIETADLHPDPAWHWGTLNNGLRYVVRQNSLPAGRVSYRLVVEVGALHERPAERGFSHFVEHMAFNGTRRFPGETLRTEMEKRGIALGPESSAFTFVTHTIYQFDAPGSTASEVDWVLSVLREFADGVTFDPKEVKRERGVIASETRDRISVSQRYDLRKRAELYPQSTLSHDIQGDPNLADAEKLRTFYHRWYRPERMMLAVVGDAAPELLAAAVERQFASLPARQDDPPVVEIGPIENPQTSTASLGLDVEAGGLSIEVLSLAPTQPDSLAERRRNLAANIATQVLTERMQVVARESRGAFSNVGSRILAASPYAYETDVYIQSTNIVWDHSATTLARELRRTLEMTVYPEEAADAKTRIIHGSELALAAAPTAQSPELAGWVMQEALWHVVSLGPKETLRLAREILPQIDTFEVANAWRSFWQPNRARIFVYGNFPVPHAADVIENAFSAEWKTELTAAPRPKTVEFPYTDFGPVGTISNRRLDAATDIHLVEFANGVRVAMKRTDFDANQVLFAAKLGHGWLQAPPYKSGLAPLASSTLLSGGLKRLSVEDLHRFLSLEPITLQFAVNEGAFQFSGNATPPKLELSLQLLCAYLTDARWDQKAIDASKMNLVSNFSEQMRTSEGVLGLINFYELTGRDLRYRAPAFDNLTALGLTDLRVWLDSILRDEPLDFALVGDFDPEAAIPLLARTLGALPARTGARAEQFPIHFAKKGHEFAMPGPPQVDRAAVQILWAADQGTDVHASRQLEVLAAIFSNRLLQRVREDLGAAYAPTADYWRTGIGTEEGYMIAYVTTAPKLASKVRKLILQEAEKLATRGATAAELTDAVTPMLARTKVQLKGNSYWLWNIALRAYEREEVLTWPGTRYSDFERITLAEVNALARQILTRERALQFSVVPGKR